MNRQLHKRRLGPAPKPYILRPLESPEPQSASTTPLKSSASWQQATHTRSASTTSEDGRHTSGNTQTVARASAMPPTTGRLDLQLTEMPNPRFRDPLKRRMLPTVGDSPRIGPQPPQQAGTDFGATRGSSIFEVDGEWVDRCVNYQKSDGRTYKLHEKRLHPPPVPVLAPSVYMKDLAPEYAQNELETQNAAQQYHNKHDFISFLTTGKLGPGPSLHQRADRSKGLQERLDSINDTNEKVHSSVETLWRMKQSWGMQRAEALQWSSGLQRPKVLTEAPSRSYRTNVGIHDLTGRVARDGNTQNGYEVTPGTLVRKGKVRVPCAGQWSMFQGEPQDLRKAPPDSFNTIQEIKKERRKQKLKAKKKSETEVAVEGPGNPKLTDEELNHIMSNVMMNVSDLQLKMRTMQYELQGMDPQALEKLKKHAENVEQCMGLPAAIAAARVRLDDRKQTEGRKTAGAMYLGEGRYEELQVRDSVDADDDDLEDRIRKPRNLSLTERIVSHRDCFKMAAAKKARSPVPSI